ncbi:MAG: hypothetical protein IIX14_03375 [Clostridia bacterium]|nr:hypothetical protein [Clostridia bacterium]
MKRHSFPLIALFLAIVMLTSCGDSKVMRSGKISNEITQTSVILKSTITEQEAFGDFFHKFNPSHTVPGLREGVIPQGMCYDETTGYLLITGYYEKEKFPSVLMAIDAKTGVFIGAYSLKTADGNDYFGHAGGIAASQNTVYITSEGECHTFPATLLSGLKNGDELRFQSRFKLNTAGSFACFYNNILWIGDFVESDDEARAETEDVTTLESGETFYAYCEGYTLTDGLPAVKKINSESNGYIPDYFVAIPEQVQGMAFTKTNKIIFSTSYGRKNNSKLYVFDDIFLDEKAGTKIIDGNEVDLYACSNAKLLEEITAPPMAEGMANHDDGIFIAFESGARKYRKNGKFPVDTLYFTTME